jgi:hypothetical protein
MQHNGATSTAHRLSLHVSKTTMYFALEKEEGKERREEKSMSHTPATKYIVDSRQSQAYIID